MASSGIKTFDDACTGCVAVLAQGAAMIYFGFLGFDGACRSVM